MSRQRLILIIVILVFGAAGLWFYFQSSSTSSTDNAAATPDQIAVSSNPDIQRIEQNLADLRRLKDLQLDTSILKNPFLQTLEPPRIPAPAPGGIGTSTQTNAGRPNPFLPF